jgi:hypothetical protein
VAVLCKIAGNVELAAGNAEPAAAIAEPVIVYAALVTAESEYPLFEATALIVSPVLTVTELPVLPCIQIPAPFAVGVELSTV